MSAMTHLYKRSVSKVRAKPGPAFWFTSPATVRANSSAQKYLHRPHAREKHKQRAQALFARTDNIYDVRVEVSQLNLLEEFGRHVAFLLCAELWLVLVQGRSLPVSRSRGGFE